MDKPYLVFVGVNHTDNIDLVSKSETKQGARISAGKARSNMGIDSYTIIYGPNGFCESMEYEYK